MPGHGVGPWVTALQYRDVTDLKYLYTGESESGNDDPSINPERTLNS